MTLRLETMKLLALVALALLCTLQAAAGSDVDPARHPQRANIIFAFPTFLELDGVLESTAARNRLHRKNLRDREAPAHSRRCASLSMPSHNSCW